MSDIAQTLRNRAYHFRLPTTAGTRIEDESEMMTGQRLR
jgi:hypothetical protein